MDQPQRAPENTDNADPQSTTKIICVGVMICMMVYYVWFAPLMARMESSMESSIPCMLPSIPLDLHQRMAGDVPLSTVAVVTAVSNASLFAGVLLLASARQHMATDRSVDYVLLHSDVLSSAQQGLLHNYGMHSLRMPPIFDTERFRTMGQYEQYEKLYAWNMTAYEVVVYIDLDSTVVGDISPLLRCPGFCMKGSAPHRGSDRFDMDDRVVVVRPNADVYKRVSDAFHGYVYTNPLRTLTNFMSYYFFHHCIFEPASNTGVVRYVESVRTSSLEFRVLFNVKHRGVRDLDAPGNLVERERCRTLPTQFNYAAAEDWSLVGLLQSPGAWRDNAEYWMPWIVPEAPVILTGRKRRMCTTPKAKTTTLK